MARPERGTHVRIRAKALPILAQAYGGLDADSRWEVVQVDAGYGRDAVVLRRDGYDGLVVAWRGQVVGDPRCDYCHQEGHTTSTATSKNCHLVKAAISSERSERMKAWWQRKRAGADTGDLPAPPPPAPEGELVAVAVAEGDEVPF